MSDAALPSRLSAEVPRHQIPHPEVSRVQSLWEGEQTDRQQAALASTPRRWVLAPLPCVQLQGGWRSGKKQRN